jgi:hypothetical protein
MLLPIPGKKAKEAAKGIVGKRLTYRRPHKVAQSKTHYRQAERFLIWNLPNIDPGDWPHGQKHTGRPGGNGFFYTTNCAQGFGRP